MPVLLERPKAVEVKAWQGFEPSDVEEAHGIIAGNNPINSIDPSGLLPDCFFDIFLPCISKKMLDPNMFTGGAPSIPEEVSLGTLASRYAALRYAMKQGLSYPLKSSVYRTIIGRAGLLAVIWSDFDIWSCLRDEIDMMNKHCCI